MAKTRMVKVDMVRCTRKIYRTIAKNAIKKSGMSLHTFIKRGVFAKHWREYCGLAKQSKSISY